MNGGVDDIWGGMSDGLSLLLLLGRGVGADVLDGLEDGFWDWWRGWDVGSGDAGSVGVGVPRDGDGLSLRRVPLGLSLRVLSADAVLLDVDAVGGLVGIVVDSVSLLVQRLKGRANRLRRVVLNSRTNRSALTACWLVISAF